MIYLDNAATSHFKPQCVYNAIRYDLQNSANSGRSGHKLSIGASERIEKTRQYLKAVLGANDNHELVFTKNCTEALNLALFGYLTRSMTVAVDAFSHNSALRPLHELYKKNKIDLITLYPKDFENIENVKADLFVINAVSNVTGRVLDLKTIIEKCHRNGAKVLVDGAQAVPLIDCDVTKNDIDMLAVPGHKGLHGVQGTGFLIFKKDLHLKPLIFGGTGTSSLSLLQPDDLPDGLESGTQNSAGISALYAGAKWTFEHLDEYKANVKRLSNELISFLHGADFDVYTDDTTTGVVSFNSKLFDSSYVSDFLDDDNIAVRSGLHCAPLVHKFLGTDKIGAVRVSFGIDNTVGELYRLFGSLEKLSKHKFVD